MSKSETTAENDEPDAAWCRSVKEAIRRLQIERVNTNAQFDGKIDGLKEALNLLKLECACPDCGATCQTVEHAENV